MFDLDELFGNGSINGIFGKYPIYHRPLKKGIDLNKNLEGGHEDVVYWPVGGYEDPYKLVKVNIVSDLQNVHGLIRIGYEYYKKVSIYQ